MFYYHDLSCSEYEVQVYGALSLSFHIMTIEKIISMPVKYVVYIDNHSVVKELINLQEQKLPSPLQPSYNLHIHTNISSIKYSIQWSWVKHIKKAQLHISG